MRCEASERGGTMGCRDSWRPDAEEAAGCSDPASGAAAFAARGGDDDSGSGSATVTAFFDGGAGRGGFGFGCAMGLGLGSGLGSGLGAGLGSGIGTGTGSGLDSGTGSDLDSDTGSDAIGSGCGGTVTGGADTNTPTIADGVINAGFRAIASVSHHSTAACAAQIKASGPSRPSQRGTL